MQMDDAFVRWRYKSTAVHKSLAEQIQVGAEKCEKLVAHCMCIAASFPEVLANRMTGMATYGSTKQSRIVLVTSEACKTQTATRYSPEAGNKETIDTERRHEDNRRNASHQRGAAAGCDKDVEFQSIEHRSTRRVVEFDIDEQTAPSILVIEVTCEDYIARVDDADLIKPHHKRRDSALRSASRHV